MSRQIPEYLRLHVEEPPSAAPPVCDSSDALDRLCESFQGATGWPLRVGQGPAPLESPEVLWARTLTPESDQPTHLAIRRTNGKSPHDLQSELLPLCDLVDSMADLLGQLHATRRALVRREAELAVGIPLVSHDEESHLAERLKAILSGGAEAIDAHAAALYMLDDATSELKLRSSWGLPEGRLIEPARPLRGAVADLEALTGHAVAIEDVSLLPHWRTPEAFASALCVPVASATNPLGTLWFFGQHVRPFTDAQTNIAEIIAGSIATELERQILLSDVAQRRQGRLSLASQDELQDAQLPIGPIATDAWEVAGLCHRGRDGGSDVYDWRVHEDDSITISMAGIPTSDVSGALTLQLIRGAMKAAILEGISPESALNRVAEVAWTSTSGECGASLAMVRLPSANEPIELCSAGPMGAMIVRADRSSVVHQGAPPLTSDPDAHYRGAQHTVAVGEAVVLVSDAVRKATNAQGDQLGDTAIAQCVCENLRHDADRLTHLVFDLWREHTDDPQRPAAILVAKHR